MIAVDQLTWMVGILVLWMGEDVRSRKAAAKNAVGNQLKEERQRGDKKKKKKTKKKKKI